jgi:hypothetical protein
MNKIAINLICSFFLAHQIQAQLIYERTYPNTFPSLKDAIQLSDFSTVSFSNNSTCYFGGWRHLSPTGSIIKEGGLANESTHSLRYMQIAEDSILVSCRVGPIDFDGINYFKVALWTPDSLQTLIIDTVPLNFWEDCEWCNQPVHYEAFQFKDNHVLYQRGDTIFSKNVLTGQIAFRETFYYITKVYPVKDGLMVFSLGLPPTYLDSQLMPIKTWLNAISSFMVAMDSFLIGVNSGMPSSLHTVNSFNENAQDIDLSLYFSNIDFQVVRGDVLIVVGKNGATNNTVQLDKNFQILAEKPFVYPDDIYPWQLSFYPDRLYAWRTDGLAAYKADYRIAYDYLNPQPITYVDLELASIFVDSVFYWPPDHHLPANLFLSAYIINHSLDTLHSLTLHHEEDFFIGCDPGVYPKHIKGLQVPPGDTAIVRFTTYSWEVAMNEPFMQTFYVQHGNDHLESDTTNNVFELIYLSSSTEVTSANSIAAYPNPFKDNIAVTGLSESVQLRLYDQNGAMVAIGYNRLDDLGKLHEGIYFLQTVAGGYISVNRVVKLE